MPKVKVHLESVTKEQSKAEVWLDSTSPTPKELASLAGANLACFNNSDNVKVYYENGNPFEENHELTDNLTLFVAPTTQNDTGDKVIRLCILGPGAVGKSALTLRYTNDHFAEEYDPTIEDAYRKSVNIDGRIATLDILDTAGQEDFTALRGAWYRKKDGFLLIFDVTQKSSLEDLKGFYDQLVDFYESDGPVPPIILIGNKYDLEGKTGDQPFWDTALAKANEYKAISCMKTSAKSGYQVEAAFANIVRAVRRRSSATVKQKKGFCTML